jgi:hypothetical protein
MLALKEVTVKGKKYQLAQIHSELAERLLLRILKIIGEPGAMLFASMSKDGKGLDKDITPDLAGLMMSRALSGMDEDLIIDTVNQLLPYIKIDAGKGQFTNVQPDVHFGGKISDKYKVIGELLKHNYADFLEDAGSVLQSVFPASQNTTQE